MLADPGQGHPVLPSIASLLISTFCAAFPQRQLQIKVLIRSWPCWVALAQQSCQISLQRSCPDGRWTPGYQAGMEEMLGLVLTMNLEPPQFSPPFLQEASPRRCLAKPSPMHSEEKEWLVWKDLGSQGSIREHGDTRGWGAAPRMVP